MNSPRWSKGRTIAVIFGVIAYGYFFCVFYGLQDPGSKRAGFGLLNFLTFVIALLALFRPWINKKVVTVALCASLAFGGVYRTRAYIAAACAIAVTVVIVGVVICVKLKQVCAKIAPPNPEEPPANPNNTNAAPDVQMSQDIVPMPRMQLEDETAYDGYNYQFNAIDPWGFHYTGYFCTVLQSSTNLDSWNTECKIKGWVSSGFMLTVFSTNGTPFYTNLCTLNAVNVSPQCVLPSQFAAERAFFRLAKP